MDRLQGQPEPFRASGGCFDASSSAATAPVQTEHRICLAKIGALHRRFDQWVQLLLIRWFRQPQQLRSGAPALPVLLQQHRHAVAQQHRFEHAVGQLQAAVIQGQRQAVGCAPAAVDPGDGVFHGMGRPGHVRAFNRGCSFHISSSASFSGSESATMPQPAWARSCSPRRISERIRMLLSKLPSQSMRISDPQ